MVMEGVLTLDGVHTIQYIDHVPQKRTPGTYVILVTNATPIHLIKKHKKIEKKVQSHRKKKRASILSKGSSELMQESTSAAFKGELGRGRCKRIINLSFKCEQWSVPKARIVQINHQTLYTESYNIRTTRGRERREGGREGGGKRTYVLFLMKSARQIVYFQFRQCRPKSLS